MGELKEKLDSYTDELMSDLSHPGLSEEQQAEIFARLEQRLKEVILTELRGVLSEAEAKKLADAFDAQNYGLIELMLKGYNEKRKGLEDKIDYEMSTLSSLILKEQENASEET